MYDDLVVPDLLRVVGACANRIALRRNQIDWAEIQMRARNSRDCRAMTLTQLPGPTRNSSAEVFVQTQVRRLEGAPQRAVRRGLMQPRCPESCGGGSRLHSDSFSIAPPRSGRGGAAYIAAMDARERGADGEFHRPRLSPGLFALACEAAREFAAAQERFMPPWAAPRRRFRPPASTTLARAPPVVNARATRRRTRDRGPLERSRRAAGVDPPVFQDVFHGSCRLGWRPKQVRVVPVRKDRAAAAHHLVQSARHAHFEALHRAAERIRIGRLHDHVDVVALHGEVHQPVPESVASSFEGAAENAEAAMRPQIPDLASNSHRDMQRTVLETRTATVRDVPPY